MDFLNAMGGTATGFFGAVIPFLIVLTIFVWGTDALASWLIRWIFIR